MVVVEVILPLPLPLSSHEPRYRRNCRRQEPAATGSDSSATPVVGGVRVYAVPLVVEVPVVRGLASGLSVAGVNGQLYC